MHLGFHYHTPAISDENGIYIPGYLGRFIDSLALHCDRLTVFMHQPVNLEAKWIDYRILAENVSLISIGPHFSLPRRLLSSIKIIFKIWVPMKKLDMLLIRVPTPFAPLFAFAAGEVPVALLVVGDHLAGLDDLQQPRWRKALIKLWWRWNKKQQMKIAQSSLTFVNSQKFYDELLASALNLHLIWTTTLRESDFFEAVNRCLKTPYRLLYTGRISREKGVLDMIRALAILVEGGEDVLLDFVGWADKNDNILKEVEALACKVNVKGRVKFQGFKPLGEELFSYYKQSDIYLIASQASEGFPRTIWEALAHSLPVVATNVGSIPDYISEVAELVPPCNPELLAEGISRLIQNPSLRRERIATGFKMVRENTLEIQSRKMISIMSEWLELNAK